MCPVDWEFTAWGGYLYDLAFIAEGFNARKRLILLNAYIDRASGYGISCCDPEEMSQVVDSLQLHKLFRSLSGALNYGFSTATVDKLVGMAEERRRSITL